MSIESGAIQEATSVTSESYHEEANKLNRLIICHAHELDINRLMAMSEYRDWLREQAFRLESLSERLKDQARKLAKERSYFWTCRVCSAGIPENEDGLCFRCSAGMES